MPAVRPPSPLARLHRSHRDIRRWRHWSDALLLGVFLLLAAYLLSLANVWGAGLDPDGMSNAFAVIFSSSALLFGVRAARHTALNARTRRAWMTLAAAFACDLVANSLWWYLEAAHGEPPFPSVADLFYLAFYPLVLAGLLQLPVVRSGAAERISTWLDIAIVTVAATMVMWVYLIAPIAAAAYVSDLEQLLSVAYPVGDCVLLFGLIVVLLNRPPSHSHTTLAWLCIGVLGIFGADVGFAYLSLQGIYESGGWLDAAWAASNVAIAVAAHEQRAVAAPVTVQPPQAEPATQVSVAPYLAIVIGYGMLLQTAFQEWPEPGRGMLIGAVGLTALVVIRQAVAARENVRLRIAQDRLRAEAAQALVLREARFRALVQHAADGLLVLDRNLVILDQTAPIERLLGYSPDALRQRCLLDLVHPESAGQLATLMAQMLQQPEPRSAVWRMRRQQGAWIEVEAIVTNLLAEPAVGGIVVNIRDLSERRARETADAANRAKSAFLAHMSHELRTPLTAILGYRDLIALKAEHDGYVQIATDLEKIQQSGRHLMALIGEVLDLAKIESDRMDVQREPVNICAMIALVADGITPLVARGGNQLVIACEHDVRSVLADELRLRQVLYNLLSNAAKFTERGTITVRVSRPLDGDPREIQIHVQDTGIGIPPERQRAIFEPFAQASATTAQRYGGTGLGLTLSRQLCRLMGGDLTVVSAPGQGSTFTIHLPAHPQ